MDSTATAIGTNATGQPSAAASVVQRRVAVLLLSVVSLTFVGSNISRIGRPFGDSHDGRNGAVWALGSRTVRHKGLLSARLGGLRDLGDGTVSPYADHPPLIYLETAAAELVGGEHPWTTRAPAWLGTVGAIFLLFFLLEECGSPPLAAVVGVSFAVGCPMIGVYGAMLDSWVVGLPWALLSLLLWTREQNGSPSQTALLVSVTAGTVLSSWLGVLVVFGIVVASVLRAGIKLTRWQNERVRAGSAIGSLMLVFLWIAWTEGGLKQLRGILVDRMNLGSSSVSPWSVVVYAVRWLTDVFAPWQLVLAVPFVLIAIWHGGTRSVAKVTLVCIIIWYLAFPTGARAHDYWGLWLVIPLACGAAVVAGRAVPNAARDSTRAGVAVALGSVGLACVGLVGPSSAKASMTAGFVAGEVISDAQYLPSQRIAWYVSSTAPPVDWITYDSHRPARRLVTTGDIQELATVDPRALVFVEGPLIGGPLVALDPAVPCSSPSGRTFFVAPASELAQRVSRRCTA